MEKDLMPRKLLLLSVLFVCLPQTSFAYVDPGTGAYVVQALAAVVGALVFYTTHPRELLRRVKGMFRRRKDPQ